MSELKATSSGEIRARDALLGYWWYEKSEADKVIADKDKEIAELKNYADEVNKDFELVDNQNERQLKIVRHNKYKRCLNMKKWCYDRWIHAYHSNKLDETRFYIRWHKRWRELAEKFKEAK